MFLLIYFYSFFRSSNSCNITIEDVKLATEMEEFPNAKAIVSSKYKTSMLYGKKMMVLANDIFALLELYVRRLRPFVVDDQDKLGLYSILINLLSTVM